MNTATLKACFQSDNFRLRLHGAMVTASKKGYPAFVKNRKGENFMRVEHMRFDHSKPYQETGFKYLDKNGKIIPQSIVYAFLSDNAS